MLSRQKFSVVLIHAVQPYVSAIPYGPLQAVRIKRTQCLILYVQDRQCTYNAALRRVSATTFAVDK